jgi:hypothetical protein
MVDSKRLGFVEWFGGGRRAPFFGTARNGSAAPFFVLVVFSLAAHRIAATQPHHSR